MFFVFAKMEGTDQVIGGALSLLAEQLATIGETPEQREIPEVTSDPEPEPEPKPEPVTFATSPAPTRQFKVSKSKPKPVTSAPKQSAEPADVQPRGAEIDLFALLQRGPITSADAIKKLPTMNQGSVYAALSSLRTKRIVETRVDESDGQRKNYLVVN